MSQRICKLPECGKPHRARGLCSTHYNQEHQPEQHAKVEVPCTHCGTIVAKHVSNTRNAFCDYACRDLYSMENKLGVWSRPPAQPKPEPKPKPPTLLRQAFEAGDRPAIIEAIRARCDIRASGCWEWQGKLHSSTAYPVVNIAGKSYQVHRISLEAKLGKRLGKQQSHHMCANQFCVNPDHLQPVTAAANMAEMLARRYMLSRIADLESALRLVQPDHPLLAEVGIDLG
jgi:endogenous inhibitor of DNA gyrase (YacG/DUF329 family)